jgi:hypothetical protein
MALKTAANKTKPTSPWPIAIALAIAVLIMQSLVTVIWSSTRPEAISLQAHNDLQIDLTGQIEAQKVTVADMARKVQSAELQKKRLEQSNAQLQQKASKLLALEQLPAQVRGFTASQCISKIRTLCDASQKVNQDNVGALLAVLVQIQKNGVINTALDAKTASRKTLYRQIQTILNQIDAYAGPIRSDKTSTLAAVKAYQTQNKLKVDGKIGINTFMTIIQSFQAKRLG